MGRLLSRITPQSEKAAWIQQLNRTLVGPRPYRALMALSVYHALYSITGEGIRPFLSNDAYLLDFMGLDPASENLRQALQRALVSLEKLEFIDRYSRPAGKSRGSNRLIVLRRHRDYPVLTPEVQWSLDSITWGELKKRIFGPDREIRRDWLARLLSADGDQTVPDRAIPPDISTDREHRDRQPQNIWNHRDRHLSNNKHPNNKHTQEQPIHSQGFDPLCEDDEEVWLPESGAVNADPHPGQDRLGGSKANDRTGCAGHLDDQEYEPMMPEFIRKFRSWSDHPVKRIYIVDSYYIDLFDKNHKLTGAEKRDEAEIDKERLASFQRFMPLLGESLLNEHLPNWNTPLEGEWIPY